MMTSESLRAESHLPHVWMMMLRYHCIHIIHIIHVVHVIRIMMLFLIWMLQGVRSTYNRWPRKINKLLYEKFSFCV